MRGFLIFALVLVISFGMVRRVSAATDCSQWLAQYKQKLEDNQRAQKLLRASRRVHAYLKRKTAVRPKVVPVLVKTAAHPRPRRPKMTALEMLRSFSIVCGDLPPEEQPAGPLLPLLKPASFTLAEPSLPPPEDTPPPAAPGAPPLLSNSPPGNSPLPPILPSGPVPGAPPGLPAVPPVPEPPTLLLVGSAAAAFAGRSIGNRRRTFGGRS